MLEQAISHYTILGKLGEGGMGVVYKARDQKLNRLVALKFMPGQTQLDEEDRRRFLQEAQSAALLNHPNVCTIYGVEEHEGSMFIVMELIEGGTLRARLPVKDIDEALALAIQAGDALREAHSKGIVHRDIKSDNIMLTSDGRAKVMDFGLAKLRGSLKLTKTSTTVGTISYMSPEQIQGGEADARSDIFSFGVVLFEMLTGMYPFRGEHEAAVMYSILNEAPGSLARLRKDVPAGFANVVDRALRKAPEQRYATMDEMLADLRKVAAGGAAVKKSTTTSIAVLAFGDMSPQKDQDYLCEGLAEELINALTKIKTLRVTSRTSAFAFKGKAMDIREIGTKLNVESILEGSVQKSGNRLRITAQLVNVSDGYQVWSERFDREMKDVFEIQDEITANIVDALKLVLTGKEKEAIAAPQTPEIEAYEFYLRGRAELARYSGGYQSAIDMFRRSIEIDPAYALAWCGLANAYGLRYLYWEATEANLVEAEKASRRAVELNPDLAEAHGALGYALSLRKNYEEADREFDMAISRNPQLYDAYYYYARTCFARGGHAKAARLFEEALRVRPEDYQAAGLASSVYRSLGEEEKYRASLRLTRDNVSRHLELHPDDARAYYMGGTALYLLGDKSKGEAWVTRALELEPDNVGTYYNVACLYAQVDQREKAIDLLKRAVELGFAHKDWIEHDPDLDPIRDNPRFREILSNMK
jgi:serine/threonine protein kinase/Flp pilus assembly protein TadD